MRLLILILTALALITASPIHASDAIYAITLHGADRGRAPLVILLHANANSVQRSCALTPLAGELRIARGSLARHAVTFDQVAIDNDRLRIAGQFRDSQLSLSATIVDNRLQGEWQLGGSTGQLLGHKEPADQPIHGFALVMDTPYRDSITPLAGMDGQREEW